MDDMSIAVLHRHISGPVRIYKMRAWAKSEPEVDAPVEITLHREGCEVPIVKIAANPRGPIAWTAPVPIVVRYDQTAKWSAPDSIEIETTIAPTPLGVGDH